MAEMLRRATEKQFNVLLPEEDEFGFGWTPSGFKRQRYGVDRLLDGDENGVNQFLRDFGLRYDPYLRWYVEGTTEWSALDEVFSKIDPRGVRLVNLRGKVAAAKDELIFADELTSDKNSQMYSFISIDGDRDDRKRAVKKAAREGKFFGRFFISQPDFEFGNFDIDELEEVLWTIAKRVKTKMAEKGELLSQGQDSVDGADPEQAERDERARLHDEIQSAQNGEQLMKRAQHALPYLAHLSKSDTWGRELMDYAGKHPKLKNGNTRPIVAAVQDAAFARRMNYTRARANYVMNAESGVLELRTPSPTEAQKPGNGIEDADRDGAG